MKALIVVDIQNDFCEGGSLEVPNANQIIPVVNNLIKKFYDKDMFVVATQDWHPYNHGSFACVENVDEFSVGELGGVEQVFWPSHCVQKTKGAKFHEDLLDVPHVVCKGMDPAIDSYSGFFDNAKDKHTGLDALLKSHGVTEVVVTGLATNYCVMFTVLDALKLGYKVTLIKDGCQGIDNPEGSVDESIQKMKVEGAKIVTGDQYLSYIH
jgi:nicotinamidase/pyrazinamidase